MALNWYAPCYCGGVRSMILGFCLLSATACDEKGPLGPTVPLNQRFTLARGEAASVEGAGLRVQFVQVTGDSRCPIDAVCIQGGDAVVLLRASGGGAPSDYQLHTGDSTRAVVTHGPIRIALLELHPYPFSSRTTAQDDYRATLHVSRP